LIETGNNNELENRGFEHTTVTTGWMISNATPSSSTTRIEGSKSLSLALTGALSLSQSSTINAAQKSGVQMVASIWVNSSDVSDLQLCSLKNGSEDKCTVTGGYVQGSGWRQLTVSFLGNSTSNGLKLKSTDTTGTVLVDQAYVGIGSPIVDFTPDMVYSAYVSSSGAVSKENTDWINGNCSVATNRFTCNFVTSLVTQPLNCVITSGDNLGGGRFASVVSISSTQLIYDTVNDAAQAFAYGSHIVCQKQGADYKTSKAYVASSSDFGYTNAGAITITATTTNPTKGVIVIDRVLKSRAGQNLKAIYNYEQSSGGSAGSGDYLFSLPSGLSFDTSLVQFSTSAFGSQSNSKAVVGYGSAIDGTSNINSVLLIAYDATRFRAQITYNGTNTSGINSSNIQLSGNRAYTFILDAPIQGWTDSGVIVGSFQGYNETPGTSRVETFSVSYGTTNATTVCSASPCSYLDQIGNAVTSVTKRGTGQYTLNLNKPYSKIKCVINAYNTISAGLAAHTSGVSASALDFNTWLSGSTLDSYGALYCQGIPQ